MTGTTIINLLLFVAICIILIHIFRTGGESQKQTIVKPTPKSPYHDPRRTIRRQAIVEHLPKKTQQQQPDLRLITYTRPTPPPVFATEKVVVEHIDEFDTHECKDCA